MQIQLEPVRWQVSKMSRNFEWEQFREIPLSWRADCNPHFALKLEFPIFFWKCLAAAATADGRPEWPIPKAKDQSVPICRLDSSPSIHAANRQRCNDPATSATKGGKAFQLPLAPWSWPLIIKFARPRLPSRCTWQCLPQKIRPELSHYNVADSQQILPSQWTFVE